MVNTPNLWDDVTEEKVVTGLHHLYESEVEKVGNFLILNKICCLPIQRLKIRLVDGSMWMKGMHCTTSTLVNYHCGRIVTDSCLWCINTVETNVVLEVDSRIVSYNGTNPQTCALDDSKKLDLLLRKACLNNKYTLSENRCISGVIWMVLDICDLSNGG